MIMFKLLFLLNSIFTFLFEANFELHKSLDDFSVVCKPCIILTCEECNETSLII